VTIKSVSNVTPISRLRHGDSEGANPKVAAAVLRPDEAAKYLGLARSSLYELLADDCSFPRPLVISGRRRGFLRAEIDAWLQARAAARGQGGA
jgi:excisionase family DNA binding protein